MKTKTYPTINACVSDTYCKPQQVKCLCVNTLSRVAYVSEDDFAVSLAGAALVLGEAAAFEGVSQGTRYFVLYRLANGDFLYQEYTALQGRDRASSAVFSMLFDSEQAARWHFQRAASRHAGGLYSLNTWRPIPFPGLAAIEAQMGSEAAGGPTVH